MNLGNQYNRRWYFLTGWPFNPKICTSSTLDSTLGRRPVDTNKTGRLVEGGKHQSTYDALVQDLWIRFAFHLVFAYATLLHPCTDDSYYTLIILICMFHRSSYICLDFRLVDA